MRLSDAATPSPQRALSWGLLLLAPAAFFLAANLLNEAGIDVLYAAVDLVDNLPLFNLITPPLFLGGLAAALLLNALAIARVGVDWKDHRLVGTVSIEPRVPNLALILSVGAMLAFFALYAFVENFRLVESHAG